MLLAGEHFEVLQVVVGQVPVSAEEAAVAFEAQELFPLFEPVLVLA